MKNNLINKTAAGLLALSIAASASAVSTTANAAEAPLALTSASFSGTVSYDAENSILTLSGNVERSELLNFDDYNKVKTIVADENTVLPADSHDLFKGFSRTVSIDLSNADTSAVTDMSGMFSGCTALTELNISSFDTSNVTNMSNMFYNCRKLSQLSLDNFNTSSVTDMSHMFSNCENLESLDLSGFDTSEVTSMHNMFGECYKLAALNLSSFNTSKVTEMHLMFDHCTKLAEIDLSSFDTSSVENMSRMFGDCSVLENIDLSSFSTANVTNMAFMFYRCRKLSSVKLNSFDTENVTSMQSMFEWCSALKELDLSSFSTASVNMTAAMFGKAALEKLTLGRSFSKITRSMKLRNSAELGWINAKNPDVTVSGTDDYAVFENNGKNTYLYTEASSFISGASLTLDGSIGINFYAALTDAQKSGAYIIFSGNCDENDQKISIKNKKAVCHVSAKNMCDTITATLYVNDAPADTKSISVKKYADTILSDPVNYAEEQDIVKAMLNYGGKTQKLFGYSTDNSADSGIDYTGSEFSYTSNFVKPADIEGVSYYGSSLILRSRTTLRHYFRITGDLSQYSFICNGDVAYPKQYNDTEYYYIDCTDLSAADLDAKTTVTIRKGKERMTLRYSTLDYVKSVIAEDSTQSQEVKDASLALYWYYKASNAYLTK